MKPLFTIHEGEYLVGAHLEKRYGLNVWVPTKDTGIDMLVSNETPKSCVSLQIKFSKDYSITHAKPKLQNLLLCSGWWTLNRKKIETSKADYWVLVIHSFYRGDDIISRNSKGADNTQYVIITPKELLSRLDDIHTDGTEKDKFQTYLNVTKNKDVCVEVRGLKADKTFSKLSGEEQIESNRDFTKFLNNWDPILSELGYPDQC